MVTIVRDRVQDLIKKGMTLTQVRQADPVKGYRAPLRRRQRAVDHRISSSRRSTRASEASECRLRSSHRCWRRRSPRAPASATPSAHGRAGAGSPPGPPPTGTAGAPIDLTGNWVSVVTEDWRWRMVTPPKGDYASVPINTEAQEGRRRLGPGDDETAGKACKAYGAAGLMRQPRRGCASRGRTTTR